MEQLIGKLLQSFEQGKMTRRQLIRSLAITTTATCAASLVPTAAADDKGLKAIAINHISYQVADYAKTRDFYADLFGMKVSEDNGKQCHLSFGDTFLIPRTWPTGTPRIDHVAYTIDNWNTNEVEAELKRRGLQLRQPRSENQNTFYVKDPDGFDLQISGKVKA